MSVEIYLNSIWKPWFEAFKARGEIDAIVRAHADDPMHALGCVNDAYRSTGAYFVNYYNAGDVMWAMGLSWHETVAPMLDTEQRLSVDRARELLAMVEARPLTREVVARHIFENMTDGVRPMQEMDLMLVVGEPLPTKPPDLDYAHAYLSKRRDGLLTLLRKSIELDEPLVCSL
jgi:hypothetical protein